MRRKFLLTALASGFLSLALAIGAAEAQDVTIEDPENTLIIEVGLGYTSDSDQEPENSGKVVVKLLPELAPNHVARIKELAREGFYDGVVFHRVIEGFMAQTGDPTGTGTGGSELPDMNQEFSDTPYERGTLGMARTSDPNSANSQFFIMFERYPSLDGLYTVFGQVIEGMEIVDRIKRGAGSSGMVQGARDRMITVRVAADG